MPNTRALVLTRDHNWGRGELHREDCSWHLISGHFSILSQWKLSIVHEFINPLVTFKMRLTNFQPLILASVLKSFFPQRLWNFLNCKYFSYITSFQNSKIKNCLKQSISQIGYFLNKQTNAEEEPFTDTAKGLDPVLLWCIYHLEQVLPGGLIITFTFLQSMIPIDSSILVKERHVH